MIHEAPNPKLNDRKPPVNEVRYSVDINGL